MHVPSAHRAILRRLKQGDDDPRSLLVEARDLPDAAWSARGLMAVSSDRRLAWEEAKAGLELALAQAKAVDRLGQRAELWGSLLKDLASWRPAARNPQAPMARASFAAEAVKDIEAMPDGQWTQDAIAAAAPHVDKAGRERLLRRALRNAGFEAQGAKALLQAAPEDRLERLLDDAPPEVRAAALPDDQALDAAWAIADDAKRAEAVRVLIWKEESEARLHRIAKSARGRDDEARVLIQVAARLDKLGAEHVAPLLDEAQRIMASLPDSAQAKLQRKLDEARDRLGGAPAEKPQAPAPTTRAVPMAPTKGHVLALVNTYDGGLKPPHLRAAARAAPLCCAFGLDLALIDFPGDLDGIVRAAQTETGIGDGGRYLVALLDAGRVHDRAHGTVVATTPNPEQAKAWTGDAKGPVTFLMGVGPKGLPRRMLDDAAHHLEVTGLGVSLETATAMGILADRLGRL